MERKLYVGNLSYKITEDAFRDAFAQAGTVEEAIIITDKFSGRSKGFGFVTMATEAEAQAAIDMWHEKELDGRKIIVNEARPPRER
ncbi:RNA-binding protein [Patescibacteria group bacterium]|nr:RNA-binding protein [Patescibacteria group bacterium]MBU1683707.1 RNA-binding protein [Patescibacteria group bacterium]MBU1935256.1 RNA-binding protein [Patescibacteria group bacterium]